MTTKSQKPKPIDPETWTLLGILNRDAIAVS